MLGLDHRRDASLNHLEHTAQICRDDAVEIVVAHSHEQSVFRDSRIGDEDFNGA